MWKEPKTIKGMVRKASTGDGRKKTDFEKFFDGAGSSKKRKK
ncbi:MULTISPECIES: hypothetical protein [Methanocalculus]|nr:hypothetical protein [Methanocalculus sp. AMF5]MCP1661998.1 hypothetical protein [Methanocalculus sp. AMF5]